MTFRSVLLGFLGAAAICGASYLITAIMRQTNPIAHFLPMGVYGVLILFVLLINPLLHFLRRRLALSGKEVAVVLVLTLAACCVPVDGLMRTFTASLVMPFHWQRVTPAWTEHKVLDRVPPYMLTDVNAKNESEVLNGFVQGLSVANQHIKPSQIPWRAWVKPLLFWMPMLLIFWVALLGLALVVHRQWADHEQLPYPVAKFADALCPAEGSFLPEICRNRLFWLGTLAVFLIHLNNYGAMWFTNLLPVPLTLDFSPLAKLFPTMMRGGGWQAFYPRILFTVIAVAYFIPADVALGLGIGPILWWWLCGMLLGYGVSMGGGYSNEGTLTGFMYFGCYVATFLVLLYTGRRYYADVFKAALLPREPSPEQSQPVWGARVFLLGTVALVLYLSTIGHLDWQLSVLFVLMAVLTFLVMSRVFAETGLFYMQANWLPTGIFLGLMGPVAFGPQAIVLVTLFMSVLLVDPREGFMPYMVNSIKILDLRRLPVGRIAALSMVAVSIGLLVGLFATLYFQYDRGANMPESWSTQIVPSFPFDQAVKTEIKLQSQNRLDLANSLGGWARFTHMMPNRGMIVAFFVGVALVLLFTLGRLRFSKWPVHPVIFLFAATFPAIWFWASFLLGWAVKSLVTKYGGGLLYRQLRPLMIGLLAGEVLGAIVPMVVGAVYYFVTGQVPKPYTIIIG